MSQIQSFFGPGIGPGGPILTLSGDSGAPVGPDGAGNINIFGQEVTTSGLGTFDVSLNPFTLDFKPLISSVTTLDGTATFFGAATRFVPANSSIIMTANVIGNRDDLGAACGGITTGVVRRVGVGAPIFVGDNTLASEDAAAGTPLFGIGIFGGASIAVYVQGLAGETWRWTCTYTFQVQLL